jgi:hypothetical protein
MTVLAADQCTTRRGMTMTSGEGAIGFMALDAQIA